MSKSTVGLSNQLEDAIREFLQHHPADAALEILAGVAINIADASDEMTEEDRKAAESGANKMLAAGLVVGAFGIGANDRHRWPAVRRIIREGAKRAGAVE